MSTYHDESHPEAVGKKVLTAALDRAKDTRGERLIAAYALGSLAHGGFSIHVSDVDLGLILDDPIVDQDTEEMADLSAAIKASEIPLATRLSVFWGSISTLSGQASGGRFPPLDRLDLIKYGRLLAGPDIREQLPSPSVRDLVVVGAEFALRVLSKPEVIAELKNPEILAASDLIPLTKHVLFPVRFFFTAGTGEVGMNDSAVKYFISETTGPAAQLAQKTLEWRYAPPEPGDPATLKVLEDGLIPLYLVFLDDYESRLRDYGRTDLAEDFCAWREQLVTP